MYCDCEEGTKSRVEHSFRRWGDGWEGSIYWDWEEGTGSYVSGWDEGADGMKGSVSGLLVMIFEEMIYCD